MLADDSDITFSTDTLTVTKGKVGAGQSTHSFNVEGTMNITRAAGDAGGIEVDSLGNVIIRLG